MSEIPIVNTKDKIIGYKKRSKLTQSDIYRISALWVTNSKDEVLLAKRSSSKNYEPNKWGLASAGILEKGETYYQNVLREVHEELGLTNIKPKKCEKELKTGDQNYFVQRYVLNIDKPIKGFKISKEEVAEIKWWSKQEIKQALSNNPDIFMKNLINFLKQLIS